VYLANVSKYDDKPLDLNPPSCILLFTFFKIRTKITISFILEMLKDYDVVRKVPSSLPRL
jgi:hypothetical protein